jgi:hypothetical protein
MLVPGLLSVVGVVVGGAVLIFIYLGHRRSALARGAAE